MNYEKACQSDILECIKLKNNVISHLKSIGANIWDEDYPSDELIKNDILFSNARVVKNNGEIIAYLCFYDPNIEYNEYPFKEEKLYTFSRLMVKENYTGKHVGTFLVQNELNCMILEHSIILHFFFKLLIFILFIVYLNYFQIRNTIFLLIAYFFNIKLNTIQI